MARTGGRHDDAVERLDAPKPLQGVYRRPTSLDARVHRHAGPARRELDRFEDGHRTAELDVLNRCVETELERDDEKVRGDENRLLGPRDPQSRFQDDGIELAIGERDEQARLPWSALEISSPETLHVRSSSRNAR
jgi:hypothetical protein